MSAVDVGFRHDPRALRMARPSEGVGGNSPMADRASPVRDRAFAALLLLVGASAIASGLFEILVLANASPAAIFDAVLGGAVLLVTWLFVVPTVWPKWYGDPSLEESPIRRPYLPSPIVAPPRSAPGIGGRPSRVAIAASPAAERKKEPEIPRWADPLVAHPASRPDSAPVTLPDPRPKPRAIEVPTTAIPKPPPRFVPAAETASDRSTDGLADIDFSSASGSPAFVQSVAPVSENETWPHPQGSSDVIRELDLITAELRNPPTRPAARTRDAEDTARSRAADPAASDDDDPLTGLD
jgi:hypothetical protein